MIRALLEQSAKTSPLNSALIVEETARECKDAGDSVYFIFLDAKSAFDVVDHKHLMRRLYHIGIHDRHWTLINSMHQQATSVVKWAGDRSDPFEVDQGVRQGGLLSADLYKVYGNPLLNRLTESGVGVSIGTICCNATACADDLTVGSRTEKDAQVLASESSDFANLERYELQAVKSVALRVTPTVKSRSNTEDFGFELNGTRIPNVTTTTHLGIKRSTTISKTAEENVSHNICKSRKTVYSLLSAGLHGHNGLDPQTSLHIIRIYVLPVLLYGLELILPNKTLTERLEVYQKKLLKRILSVPNNTPDAAVYMLSGFIPIEAQIHKKALVFFNNVCLQPDSAIEKRLAIRQSTVKNLKSNSWFMDIKKLLWKYDLGDIEECLNSPLPKLKWKNKVNQAVHNYWTDIIKNQAVLYGSLTFLNVSNYQPGKLHPFLQIEPNSVRDIPRLAVKLKLLCGVYVLQSTRASFNQNDIDPTCQVCSSSPETLLHFILECPILETIRNPIISDITFEYAKLNFTTNSFEDLSADKQLQIIMDCTVLFDTVNQNKRVKYCEKLQQLEYQTRRLLHNLHCARYRMVKEIPSRRR